MTSKSIIAVACLLICFKSIAQNNLLDSIHILKSIIQKSPAEQVVQPKEATVISTQKQTNVDQKTTVEETEIFSIQKRQEVVKSITLFENQNQMIEYFSSGKAFLETDRKLMVESIASVIFNENPSLNLNPSYTKDRPRDRSCNALIKADANVPQHVDRALSSLIRVWKNTVSNTPPTFHNDSNPRDLEEVNFNIRSLSGMIRQVEYMYEPICMNLEKLILPMFSQISAALGKAAQAEKDSRIAVYQKYLDREKVEQQNQLNLAKKRDEEKKVDTQKRLDEERQKIENENKRLNELKSKRVGG